jgi:hypothetical protein
MLSREMKGLRASLLPLPLPQATACWSIERL